MATVPSAIKVVARHKATSTQGRSQIVWAFHWLETQKLHWVEETRDAETKKAAEKAKVALGAVSSVESADGVCIETMKPIIFAFLRPLGSISCLSDPTYQHTTEGFGSIILC